MADTKQPHAPVEGDGINYRGIIWFVVVLAIVTVSSQVLIWVVLRTMQHNQAAAEAPIPAVAAPSDTRQAMEGRVYPGMVAIGEPGGPAPPLLVKEPENLAAMRAREDEVLSTWGVADQAAGTYRMPIDRAKALLLERGLPVRGQTPEKGK
jgi:hypothetical protein